MCAVNCDTTEEIFEATLDSTLETLDWMLETWAGTLVVAEAEEEAFLLEEALDDLEELELAFELELLLEEDLEET